MIPKLTRFEWPRRFGDRDTSFVQQFQVQTKFRCFLCLVTGIWALKIYKNCRNLRKINFTKILTEVGANKSSKFFFKLSRSSRHSNRRSWDAARCSDGRRLGLQVISSRNAIVCARKPSSCSKSWKCFDTQCLKIFLKINFISKSNRKESNLKTFNTRIVAGELTTDSFLFLAASTSGGSSRGFEDADVAVKKKCNICHNYR